MANIKIPQLSALVTQVLTDVYEMSPAVAVPGSSHKETRQQIITYMQNYVGTGVLEVYVDSSAGIDAIGRGSSIAPYLTISFALSQITTASSTTPYLINASGSFSDSNWMVKPYINYNFNNGSYSVTNIVSLDPSFSAGGNVLISNINGLTLSNGLAFDFNALSVPFAFISFSNVMTQVNSLLDFVGNASGTTIVEINGMFGLGNEQNIQISNSYGAISNSTINTLTISHTSETTGGNFNLELVESLSPANIIDNTASGLIIFSKSNIFGAGITFSAQNSGTLDVINTGSLFLSSLIIDGATSVLNTDVLNITPTYINGSSSSNVTINARNALSAGTGITYSSTTGVISSTAGGAATLQSAYDNSTPANIDMVVTNPITFSSTTEVARPFPSMTTTEYDAISKLNAGVSYATDTNRLLINIGDNVTPVVKEFAYTSDLATIPNASYGEMYFSGNTATPTPIVTMGVPVQIVGSYNAGSLLNFTFTSGGTLTYTGTVPIPVVIQCELSGSMDISSDQVATYIYQNGALLPDSQMNYDLDAVTPSFKAIPTQAVTTVAPGDTIEIFIANLTSTNDPTVNSLNCSILSVGGAATGTGSEVVVSWDGLTSSTNVLGSSLIDITGGVISYTGNSIPTEQDIYDNSAPANVDMINGNPFTLSSTTEVSRPIPSMTAAQFLALVNPINGGQAWLSDTGRITVNTGTPSVPVPQTIAYLTDTPGMATLQSTYTNSTTGVIVVTTSKPLTMQSNATAVIPQYNLFQSNISNLANPISVKYNQSLNDSAAIINYTSDRSFIISSATGFESGMIEQHAMRVGTDIVYQSYNGFTSQYNINANVDVANSLVAGLNNAGVNLTLGSTLTPTLTYPAGVFTSMWQTLSGTNTIVPQSFAIGDTIEIDMIGVLNVVSSGANVDTGSLFRIVFGSSFTATSSSIPLEMNVTRTRPFQFRVKITRASATTLNASGIGWYLNNGQGFAPITIFFPSTPTYNENISYTIGVQFLNGNGSTSFNFQAMNLNIKQYT